MRNHGFSRGRMRNGPGRCACGIELSRRAACSAFFPVPWRDARRIALQTGKGKSFARAAWSNEPDAAACAAFRHGRSACKNDAGTTVNSAPGITRLFPQSRIVCLRAGFHRRISVFCRGRRVADGKRAFKRIRLAPGLIRTESEAGKARTSAVTASDAFKCPKRCNAARQGLKDPESCA